MDIETCAGCYFNGGEEEGVMLCRCFDEVVRKTAYPAVFGTMIIIDCPLDLAGEYRLR
jgi:hypothetical protein